MEATNALNLDDVYAALMAGESGVSVARRFGYSAYSPLRMRLLRAGYDLDQVRRVRPSAVPPAELPVDAIVEDRKRRFAQRKAHQDAGEKLQVEVKETKPFAIWVFGDPHVDDDGCDFPTLEHHARTIARTPGLYGMNIGDTTNNWIGRLARLYANQSTTSKEALMLAKWFIELVGEKWVAVVGGNHDLWSGDADYIGYLCRDLDVLYMPHACRFTLSTPSAEFVIDARHAFRGNSQWNTVHAQMKAALMLNKADVLIGGHWHKSGYGIVPHADGSLSHCIQLGAYKVYDSYAQELGLPPQQISPGAMLVFDPCATRPAARVTYIPDFDKGVAFLQHLRATP